MTCEEVECVSTSQKSSSFFPTYLTVYKVKQLNKYNN